MARHPAARSEEGKLCGGLALKPAPRVTRCGPRQRARSTRCLLEHATEVGPVFTQFDRSIPSLSRMGAKLSGIAPACPGAIPGQSSRAA